MDLLLNNVTLPLYLQTYPYIQSSLPYLQTAYSSTTTTLHPLYTYFLTTISPLLLPFLDTISKMAMNQPAYFAIALLLVGIYVTVMVLGWMKRMVQWGVKMLFGVVFWGAVGVGCVLVWERGVARTGVEVLGWVRGVLGVWWGEWEKARREREGGSVSW